MMGVMGTTTLLSFEDFEQLPSEPGNTELLDGELIQLPPAKRRHVKLAHRMRDRLDSLLKKDGAAEVGEVDLGMGYKFGVRSWLRPDVSVEHVDQAGDDYFENSPMIAIEIVSEFDLAVQMDRKIKTYLSNGGHEVWVVYPKTKCVWVYRETHAQECRGVLRSEIAGGLEIDIHDLFD
jgi:Uma2 family endonuclease